MATDPISTDLHELHRSIEERIATQFPDFKTVAFYRDDTSDRFPTPACLLELDGFEHGGGDDGTEQVDVTLRFSARLVFNRENGPEAPLNLRLASAALCRFIHLNRFCGRVSEARVVSAGEDYIRPDLTGRFSIWRIEWVHHQALFGESVWVNDGSVPIGAVYSNGEDISDV